MICKRLSAKRHRVPKNPKNSQKNKIILKKFHKNPKPKCILSHKTSHPLAILICKRPSAKRHRVLKLLKKFHKNPKTCDMQQEAVSKKAHSSKKSKEFTKKLDNSEEIP